MTVNIELIVMWLIRSIPMVHVLKAFKCLLYDVYSWLYRIYKDSYYNNNSMFGVEPKKK